MIYVEGPAAAVAIMPNLICYFSIPTVACIWYIDFLPPHCLGSLPVFFFWFVCLELEEGVQSSEHSSPGCDIRMERLEVGIGEHAAGWAACSFAFSFIVPQVLVQIALPLVCIVCMQQIMVMTRLQMSSCLPCPG